MARFASVHHHVWRTQATLNKRKKKNLGEKNGPLRFCPPPRVAHVSRLDQKYEKSCSVPEVQKFLTITLVCPMNMENYCKCIYPITHEC